MSWTKRQLISKAYSVSGLADYVYDLQPEQYADICGHMDAMIASWAGGLYIRMGYPISSNDATLDVDQDSNLPAYAIYPVYMNLGLLIAFGLGKEITPKFSNEAEKARLNLLNANSIMPPSMQFPSTMPRGAGAKSWRNTWSPFIQPPDPSLATGGDNELPFK